MVGLSIEHKIEKLSGMLFALTEVLVSFRHVGEHSPPAVVVVWPLSRHFRILFEARC